MTILLDDREGSGSLAQYTPLRDLATLTRLEYGDAAFLGRGPNDSTPWIGIEVKSLFDLLSSLDTKRLQGSQLPGMLAEYDVSYLLVYGVARSCPRTGKLQIPVSSRRKKGAPQWQAYKLGTRSISYTYLTSSLLSIEAAGVRIAWVPHIKDEGARGCAAWIAGCYTWWSKPWEDHTLFQCFDLSQDLSEADFRRLTAPSSASTPAPIDRGRYRVAKTLNSFSGIGHKRAVRISSAHSSLLELLIPSSKQWSAEERKAWREEAIKELKKVPGVGVATAKSIVATFEGG